MNESSRQGGRRPPWLTEEREAWLAEVTEWVIARLETLGLNAGADIVPFRERLWGAVLRVKSSDGVLFLKAEGPGALHEPAIIADIASTYPELVPDLLAADLDRGWLLMSDQGVPMMSSVDVAEEIPIWEQIFSTYARAQRALSGNVERWIEAGTPDRRLPKLPALVENLLAGGSVPLDQDARRKVASALPDLVSICDELAVAPFAQAIDHSDMHAGNVLVGRGAPRLVDWGDACITHPFASPFVTYQHTIARLPPSERPAAARRLRDVYLEPWSEDASPDDLRDTFAKATWLGHVIRALNFAHQLIDHREWGDSVTTFLTRWQEQRVLLGRGDELILTIASQVE